MTNSIIDLTVSQASEYAWIYKAESYLISMCGCMPEQFLITTITFRIIVTSKYLIKRKFVFFQAFQESKYDENGIEI